VNTTVYDSRLQSYIDLNVTIGAGTRVPCSDLRCVKSGGRAFYQQNQKTFVYWIWLCEHYNNLLSYYLLNNLLFLT